jgi:hypothetical protein
MNKEPKIRSVGKQLTAGVANTVYTCPDNFIAKMVLLFASNRGSGNKTVSIQWHDYSAGANYYIVGGYVISAYGFLKLDGSYLVLNPGDTLVITPEAASTIDAVVTVEEYYEQGLF